MSAMKLAACILHYGDPALTGALHRQMLQADPQRADDIFVLDNASPEPYPGAWKRLPENIFWAGALGWALDAFAAADYTHLWFCNNDMAFVSPAPYMKRAAERCRWLEKQGRVGVWSPAVTFNPYHAHMTAIPGEQCRAVGYVDGIAPVVSLACMRDIGGLDCTDNPYGYGVDIWLSLRAARAGWGVWVDHTVVVRHQYHTAAKQEEHFLSRAASAENAYMTTRLGEGWRETLATLQSTR